MTIQDTEETRVIFRRWRDTKDAIAFFPDCHERPGTVSSYMHVGQHSAARYPHSGTIPADVSGP